MWDVGCGIFLDESILDCYILFIDDNDDEEEKEKEKELDYYDEWTKKREGRRGYVAGGRQGSAVATYDM